MTLPLQLALRNALRYFPPDVQKVLAPEFAQELRRYGHIYMYRFSPSIEMRWVLQWGPRVGVALLEVMTCPPRVSKGSKFSLQHHMCQSGPDFPLLFIISKSVSI